MPRYQFKVSVIGDVSVGKTSLIKRLINNEFKSVVGSTIGVSFVTYTKEIIENHKGLDIKNNIELQIWDTAGEERIRSGLLPQYIKKSHVIIFCCDPTRDETIKAISDEWMSWCFKHLRDEPENIKFYIVFTKGDLIKLKDTREKKELRDKLDNTIKIMKENPLITNLKEYQTSAKSGEGVKVMFDDIADELFKTSKDKAIQKNKEVVELDDTDIDNISDRYLDEKSNCC